MTTDRKTTYRNLTPHPVTVRGPQGGDVVFPVAGPPVRLRDTVEPDGHTDEGVPIVRVTVGEAVGLPDEEDGVINIVSRVTACALSNRKDLVFPVGEIRDEKGQIEAVSALARYIV